MIYQTDKQFPDVVNHNGCYLLSLCERVMTSFSLPFTYESVLDVYGKGQAAGKIDSECTLLDPQWICDNIAGYGHVVFIGRTDPFYSCLGNDLEILCFHKDGASFNHFVSGDGKGLVHYDPWSFDGSDSVKNGSVIGKRIYRRTT